MNIIIIGPQGSGKGTQADLLAERFKLGHVESGGILREYAKQDKRIKEMIDSGKIVPDDETLSYIDKFISQKDYSYSNMIFDGYPRTIEQYELLKKYLKEKGSRIDLLIYIAIPDETAIARIVNRRTCNKCGRVYNLVTNPPRGGKCNCGGELLQRSDDTPKIIQKRLEVFKKNTKPILDIAKGEINVLEIDGEQPIKDIFEDILEGMDIK